MATTQDPFGPPPAPPLTGGPSGPRAGFWQRLGAALLDGILLGVIQTILTAVLKVPGQIIAIVIVIGYYVYLEGGATGQTLGKRALGIRVVSFDTGGPIGYPRAFVRYIGRIISAVFIFLGYLWMLWDREKQTWHDKMASAVVVPTSSYPVVPPPADPAYPSGPFAT
jgi:uncharacterized RDD family membrane protein YckC